MTIDEVGLLSSNKSILEIELEDEGHGDHMQAEQQAFEASTKGPLEVE